MFSDVDLAFNAGDDMAFGGRVHTNGNLYLAEAANHTLTLSDKVTAVKEIVRTRLSNGVAVTVSGHTGTVKLAKAPGTYRNLGANEGAAPDAVHYRGSLATFFYNRQAVGIFKGSGNVVYNIPAFRDYMFDVDFLDPALLPPNTPVFRDMNAVGFSQELRPNK